MEVDNDDNVVDIINCVALYYEKHASGNAFLPSLCGRRKKGRGRGREKGKREGSACSNSLCFCITTTNFLVVRLHLLEIKCRYTRQSERKVEPCGYAKIYLICRELTLHKYLSKREILTSGQPEI